MQWDAPTTIQFIKTFFISGGAGAVVEMLTKNNFMPLADVSTKRAAYLSVLKLTKAVLTVTSNLLIQCDLEVNHIEEDRLRVLADAIQAVPHPTQECVLRTVTAMISKSLIQAVWLNSFWRFRQFYMMNDLSGRFSGQRQYWIQRGVASPPQRSN